MKEFTVTFIQHEVKVDGKAKKIRIASIYSFEYDKTVTMSIGKFLEMVMPHTRRFKEIEAEDVTLSFSMANEKVHKLLGLPKRFKIKNEDKER